MRFNKCVCLCEFKWMHGIGVNIYLKAYLISIFRTFDLLFFLFCILENEKVFHQRKQEWTRKKDRNSCTRAQFFSHPLFAPNHHFKLLTRVVEKFTHSSCFFFPFFARFFLFMSFYFRLWVTRCCDSMGTKTTAVTTTAIIIAENKNVAHSIKSLKFSSALCPL